MIAPAGKGAKIAPVLTQYLLLGTVLGLLAGVGLAYLAEVTDKSFRTPEEIRRHLGLPVVGHIPFFPPAPEHLGTAAEDFCLDPSLVYFQPKSVEAESFRGVRTALSFSTQGEEHKVIQVTSPSPGDGKSTVTANLAISIAQSGKKVLLIDCDFRKPRQHKLFRISPSTGMASVIAGQSTLANAIQTTVVDGLWLLPCGPRPNNPAELLTSPQFKDLVDQMPRTVQLRDHRHAASAGGLRPQRRCPPGGRGPPRDSRVQGWPAAHRTFPGDPGDPGSQGPRRDGQPHHPARER